MKQQYKNLVALLAIVLVGAKGHADSSAPTGNENLNSAIEKVRSNIQSVPALARVIPGLAKSQLEDLIEQDLSDRDYTSLQKLLAGLANQNVPVEIIKPHDMTLGGQEIIGSGAAK